MERATRRNLGSVRMRLRLGGHGGEPRGPEAAVILVLHLPEVVAEVHAAVVASVVVNAVEKIA